MKSKYEAFDEISPFMLDVIGSDIRGYNPHNGNPVYRTYKYYIVYSINGTKNRYNLENISSVDIEYFNNYLDFNLREKCLLHIRNDRKIQIFKCEDEYYFVSIYLFKPSIHKHYKCDQREGVIDLLKSHNLCSDRFF